MAVDYVKVAANLGNSSGQLFGELHDLTDLRGQTGFCDGVFIKSIPGQMVTLPVVVVVGTNVQAAVGDTAANGDDFYFAAEACELGLPRVGIKGSAMIRGVTFL